MKRLEDLRPDATRLLVDFPDPKLLVECSIPDEPVVSGQQNRYRSAKGPGRPEGVAEKDKSLGVPSTDDSSKGGGSGKVPQTQRKKFVKGGEGEPHIPLDHDLESSNRALNDLFEF